MIELSDYATQESGFPLLTSSRQGLFVQEDYFIDKQANAETTVFSVLPYGCITYRHMSDDNIFHFNINRLVANGLVSKEYPVFTVRKEVLDTDFLVDTLNSSPLFSVFCIQQKKGGTRTRLYFKTLCSYQMFLPVLHEQQVIASFIRLLDKRIERQMELVETLKKYKRGVMRAIFRDKAMLVSKAAKWKSVRLGTECAFFSGGTPKSTDSRYYGGTIPFIRSGEIHEEQTELFLTSEGLRNSSAKMVSKGDLILALYGATSGEVDISRIDGAINQAILCIRPAEINRIFLKYLLEDSKDDILNTYLQGGQGNLSAEIIKSLVVDVPDGRSQQGIVDFLSVIDQRINNCLSCLETLMKLRGGLMQQLFI